ncbi:MULTISPECIES: hypothetical protein [Rhodococcus]|uniref:hypothetical protein n=1 Tax=Rhodococcus TaxID=1827 RepID=UPI0007BC8493|nr:MULTISPECIES: hypothetical protein [Rhodococcus]KZF17890.1 hypothetical protein A2J01_23070 [Rhodococcus sp. EPR-134]MDJ0441722.1 hypothetical protein [Rhodococcus qingshengii]
MLTIRITDNAAAFLGLGVGFSTIDPTDGLTPQLRAKLNRGIERRGKLLVWADSRADDASPPANFFDYTGWECNDSSFHLEDYVPLRAPNAVAEDFLPSGLPVESMGPFITRSDQRALLEQGIAFAREFAQLVYDLPEPTPVRCMIFVNSNCGTFRFHQIEPGVEWTALNRLEDDYPTKFSSKGVVVDIIPSTTRTYRCQVCGYPGLRERPYARDGSGSGERCPACAFTFDAAPGADQHRHSRQSSTHEQWRERWISGGMRWQSAPEVPQPVIWEPVNELAELLTMRQRPPQ